MTAAESTLVGVLGHHARVTPDRAAVTDETGTVSYGELDRRAGHLATLLLEQGGSPGSPVGMMVDPGIEALVALYGVMKAGMVVVPLDQAAPDEALADIARGARLTSVVVDEVSRGRGVASVPVLVVGDTATPNGPSGGGGTLPVVGPDDRAAVYYTSGSTGRAKGFVITHGAQVSGARSWCEGYGLRAGDRMALLFHHSFGASRVSLFGALVLGAELRAYDVRRTGPAGLAASLDRDGVTFVHCAPSLLRSLFEPLPAGPNLQRVRLLATGAEALHQRDLDLLRERLWPGCRLAYSYAVSEAGPVAALLLDPSTDAGDGLLPVGPPLPGKHVTIDRPDRTGVGEIIVAGDGLASGYWLDDVRTAERFGPAPHDPAARAFRTGDRGRLRADGMLELHGRVDRVMKVRGFSVDLADVERSLRQSAAIREVAVTVREGRRPQLVAYVVPEADGPPIDVVGVRAELAERVPPHMVPAAIVALDALPRTSRGKVDTMSLPAVPRSRPPLHTELVRPRDDLEEAITAAWEHVLEVSPIGVHDDFFALGGDSLAVVEARAVIEERLGREVPMAAFLQGPTPAELAQLLRVDAAEWWRSSVVPLRTAGTRPPLFLVHGGGGNVLAFRHLAGHLSSDQPVYALQVTETPPRFLSSVGRLAGHYLAQVREVQPHGPYLVGGFSSGGAVALAMASRLAAVGEQPALVVNLDGIAPHLVRARLRRRVAQQLSRYARLELKWLAWRLRWARWRLVQIGRTNPTPSPWHDVKSSKLILARAILLHRPRRYDGRMLLVRAGTRRAPDLGWRRSVATVDIVTISGTHRAILEPPLVDVLAGHLDAAIADALASSATASTRDAATQV